MSANAKAPARVIAGNWKMYKSAGEALALVNQILESAGEISAAATLLVFPPFTAIATVAERCRGTRIGVGGQNLHPAPEGAYTGEISGPMLRDAGATHVLIGHSERRQHFHEDDEFLKRKLAGALAYDLTPIFCLGETLEDRDRGRTEEVISRQVEAGLYGLGSEDLRRVLIAYEPVWAIGTGRTATPDQAREAHVYLRKLLLSHWGGAAETVPLLYGGSVKPSNARDLLSQPEVNGALVGGASLEASYFLGIARAID